MIPAFQALAGEEGLISENEASILGLRDLMILLYLMSYCKVNPWAAKDYLQYMIEKDGEFGRMSSGKVFYFRNLK